MSDGRAQVVVLAALLVGLAAGGIVTAAFVDAPGGGAGGLDDRTQPAGSGAPATSIEQPIGETNDSSVYIDLYDESIDSVVTVRVAAEGGTGQGTGFVYDRSGHVVTNQHVVAGAQDVAVRFTDGSWRSATVVGTDVYTDLAVLHVEDVPAMAEPLPVARETPETGQRVAAIGSPFGLEGTITSGIVSGVNRSMATGTGFSIPATVQTDAAINPGNSGGPLVSLDGTVVGVNRAKRGDNVGYAISPQLVRRVVPALIQHGDYNHPYMGIQTVPVTPTVAEANGLEEARGVHVVGVLRGGPAAEVLQPATGRTVVQDRIVRTGGDVILAVEGTPITSQQQLNRVLMLRTSPDETISVTILRDGERRTVSLALGRRPPP